MILDNPLDYVAPQVFVRLHHLPRSDVVVLLKNEALNPAGSIKFKPAVGIVRDLEQRGVLGPDSVLIDTTSGNMGIALSLAARANGYDFICVCDDKITLHNRALLTAYGIELIVMGGSSLQERYRYIQDRLASDPRLVWTRQFMNATNPAVHARTTALEIFDEIPRVDYLFVGTGTAGTLAGCAQAIAERTRATRLIAVDAVGSYHFLNPTSGTARHLPGIGATERSPFLTDVQVDDVVIVEERDAVRHCRDLVRRTGWLFGASTGSVLSAIAARLDHCRPGDTIVGIAADSGERYLDSVYDDGWTEARFTPTSEPIAAQ